MGDQIAIQCSSLLLSVVPSYPWSVYPGHCQWPVASHKLPLTWLKPWWYGPGVPLVPDRLESVHLPYWLKLMHIWPSQITGEGLYNQLPLPPTPHRGLYCFTLVIQHGSSRQIGSYFARYLSCTTQTLIHLFRSLNSPTIVWRSRHHKMSMPQMNSGNGAIDTLYSQGRRHLTLNLNRVWVTGRQEWSVPQNHRSSLYPH